MRTKLPLDYGMNPVSVGDRLQNDQASMDILNGLDTVPYSYGGYVGEANTLRGSEYGCWSLNLSGTRFPDTRGLSASFETSRSLRPECVTSD